jgi:AraC-like DNA-binding protein
MRYQQILPIPALQHYIRYFWVLENTCADLHPKHFKIIPDGNPGLIFQDSNTFLDSCHQKLPTTFLYGQTTQHTVQSARGKFKSIGVYFYPDAISTIFGISAAELTNRHFDISLLTNTAPRDQLLHAVSIQQSIEILSAFFISLMKKNKKQENNKVRYCLASIAAAKGNVTLGNFPRELYISESNFERAFKHTVGISPKLYTRITRFQAALNQLRSRQYEQLSDIAFDNHYADQSHFIREFKAFTGIVPHYFHRQTNEVVANFPELLA